ncbi:MAG TPA: hypothetical protein VMZ04_02240 [Anaerolineae bacterium]|nr:hypothetical protein [Anaerolineae bacterium]
MEIPRTKALQILSVLGFESMVKQPNKVLAKRLLNIDSYITPETVFVDEDLDLIDEMALADSITVTGEMDVPAPRKKKKKIEKMQEDLVKEKPAICQPLDDALKSISSDAPIPPKKVSSTKPAQSSKRRGRSPGIGATIIETLKKGHYTKKEIHMVLQQKFPERSARAMKNTVDSQVPTGIRKEKGIEVLKDYENKYYIEKE